MVVKGVGFERDNANEAGHDDNFTRLANIYISTNCLIVMWFLASMRKKGPDRNVERFVC